MATTNKPADVKLSVKKGTDLTIQGTGAYVSTGHTFGFYVHNKNTGALVFSKTSASGITHTQATPTTIIDISIAEADTAGMSSVADYRYAVYRTNSGSKTPLREGPFVIEPTPEVADV